MSEVKKFTKCKRELMLNSDYFYVNRARKDGFGEKCKECSGQNFTKYHQLKDGEMFCKRCEKILPYTDEYYPKDKSTKTGLRNVCYICSKGKAGSARYGKRKERALEWKKEEDLLLISLYPDNTNEEIIDKFPNRTIGALTDRASSLKIEKSPIAREKQYKAHSEKMKVSSAWIGVSRTDEEKENLSLLMKERWKEDYDTMLKYVQYERSPELRKNMSNLRTKEGRWKGENNPRYLNPLKGSENGRWEGGITPILFWLRNQLDEWKKDSMKFHNYTCILSGKNFDEIHHLHSFKKIVTETLNQFGWKYGKTLEECSEEELELLREMIILNNNKYGLGVCLTKVIHKHFHDLYGYGNNTPEQFEEFSKRYKNGEFDEILSERSA